MKTNKQKLEYNRKYRKEHTEELKAYSRKYERENKRWRQPKRSARAVSWNRDNPDRAKEIMRKHKHKISSEEYLLKKKKQNNRCAICGLKETIIHPYTKKVQALAVDHNHKTGKIRDLLCSFCNRGLGMFLDDPKLLLKASQYLKKHEKE